jgi:hypothetical protein
VSPVNPCKVTVNISGRQALLETATEKRGSTQIGRNGPGRIERGNETEQSKQKELVGAGEISHSSEKMSDTTTRNRSPVNIDKPPLKYTDRIQSLVCAPVAFKWNTRRALSLSLSHTPRLSKRSSRLLSTGIHRRAVRRKLTDVSKEHIASIFRV